MDRLRWLTVYNYCKRVDSSESICVDSYWEQGAGEKTGKIKERAFSGNLRLKNIVKYSHSRTDFKHVVLFSKLNKKKIQIKSALERKIHVTRLGSRNTGGATLPLLTTTKFVQKTVWTNHWPQSLALRAIQSNSSRIRFEKC